MTLIENWEICRNKDESLLKRQNSFVKIYQEISPIINRHTSKLIADAKFIVKGIDIEDITQEALGAIWRTIHSTSDSLPDYDHPGQIVIYFKTRLNWTVNNLRKKFSKKDNKTYSFDANNTIEEEFTKSLFFNSVDFAEYYALELDVIFGQYTQNNHFCAALIYRYKILNQGITYEELSNTYEEYHEITPQALAVRQSNCMKNLKQFVESKLIN